MASYRDVLPTERQNDRTADHAPLNLSRTGQSGPGRADTGRCFCERRNRTVVTVSGVAVPADCSAKRRDI